MIRWFKSTLKGLDFWVVIKVAIGKPRLMWKCREECYRRRIRGVVIKVTQQRLCRGPVVGTKF